MVTLIGKHGVSYARTAPAQSNNAPRHAGMREAWIVARAIVNARHAAPAGLNATVQRLIHLGLPVDIARGMARRNATA